MRVLLKVVLGAAAMVVVGWFGYQVYVHLTDARTADERIEQVSRAWEDDPASLAAAAASGSRVTPPALADATFQQLGALAVDSWSVEGTTLRLRAVAGSCDAPTYRADLKVTGESVVVLVHPQTSWLPDLADAWQQLRGEVVACDAVGVPITVDAVLDDPPGDRLVIDAVSGSSVPPAP